MPSAQPLYRGRFAPSPTGPLHLGSLIAALASYLDARHCGGQWLMRMEDLDPPREEAGAADSILAMLRAHGLHWDGECLWQSRRHQAYAAALAELEARDLLFRCDCTRAMLGPNGSCGGRCEPRQAAIGDEFALRIKVVPGTRIEFSDRLQGNCSEALGDTLADFILRRKDGLYAYQLAVVVDDGHQAVSHVVRGSDLLDSTARQLYLQRCLGLPQPEYLHLPVITGAEGQKLSKQNHAPALRASRAAQNLRQALAFLNQPPPPPTLRDCPGILDHAIAGWNPAAVPALLAADASRARVPALPPTEP